VPDFKASLGGPRRRLAGVCETGAVSDRRTPCVAAALAAVLLAAPPPGAAGDDRPKTHVKIKRLERSGASGTVRSRDNGCERHRTVRVFRLDDFISVKVQISRSDSEGRWRIERDLDPCRYFAKADGDSRCRYDNSKIETLRQG
jgi:hypothetical protein